MSIINKEYIKFWDYEKNGINPENITFGSNREVWWRCPIGHSFEKTVKSVMRLSHESKVCNICNSFAGIHPEFEEFYNHKLSVTPFNELPSSINRKKNFFICDAGHNVEIYDLKALKSKDYINSHCRLCKEIRYSFALKFPDRLKWWDHEKNTISPNEVKLSDNIKAWFTCDAGHEFLRNPFAKITSESFCPSCSHPFISFKDRYSEIVAKYWNYDENDAPPEEISFKTSKLIYLKCPKGHEFSRNTDVFLYGDRELCPECRIYSNSIKIVYPELYNFYDNNKNIKSVDEASAILSNRYWWKCSKWGHEFQARLKTMVKVGDCYYCSRGLFSISEKELQGFIKNNYNGELIYNDRRILGGKELDIYIPYLNKAIEFNGDYWHSNTVVFNKSNGRMTSEDYHSLKFNKARIKGIELIFVWEHDWLEHGELVKGELLKFLSGGKYNERLFSKLVSIMDTGECCYCEEL